jgi:peptide/nickel transport system substrate-binding protein
MSIAQLVRGTAILTIGFLTMACAAAEQPAPAAPATPSSSSSTSSSSTEATTSSSGTTTEAKPETEMAKKEAAMPAMAMPKSGGIFNVPVTDDPFDFDMTRRGSSNANPYVIKESYSSLLRFKKGPDVPYTSQEIEPSLAESWQVSGDGKTYTLNLRRGVKFANRPTVNGRELTSADVKWTIEYTARLSPFDQDKELGPSRYTYFYEGLQSVTTPDPYKVVIQFKDVFAPFLTYMASSDSPIIPHEIYDADGSFTDTIAGTGPYQLDQDASQQGSKWVMQKNPTYFEKGKPYVDTINLIVIREDATRLAAYTTKQVDYIVGGRDPSVWDEIQRAVPTSVGQELSGTPAIMALNFTEAPFDNLTLRKALSLGIDRDELVKSAAGGKGSIALAFTNTRNDLFTEEEKRAIARFDPEEAKRLVKEAGYPNGVEAEMIYSGNSIASTKPAELVQAQLKKVGINIVLNPLPTAEMTKRRRAFDGQIFWLSEASRTDIDAALFLAVHSKGRSNYNQIAFPEIDAKIVDQRREKDPAKRLVILRDIFKTINEEAYAIPTYRVNQAVYTHPYVKNFFQTADRRTQGFMDTLWLDK